MSGIMLNVVGGTYGGLPAIGAAYGGGFFAGQINVSGTIYNLVVADVTVGESYGKKWTSTSPITTGSTSVINGPTNSSGLAARGATYQSAVFCEDLNTGGFTDWYLPALNELEVCYFFLKPGTGLFAQNNTASGSNANAVSPEPVSTNYTNSGGNPLSPARTTATAFQAGGAQDFQEDQYFCSTEGSDSQAYTIGFNDGTQDLSFKTNGTRYTRAVRRVLA
jgi:hypothetical protein